MTNTCSKVLLFAMLTLKLTCHAAIPDLTAGESASSSFTNNMGPTGFDGWLFHERYDTSKSRQILVTKVDPKSPADGVLAVGDVILGVNGTDDAPSKFSKDARRSLADAINEAEARDPAVLRLIRWRKGSERVVALKLKTLGGYSDTAPYNCRKSARILERAVRHVMKHDPDGGVRQFGTLGLLAVNNPANPDNARRQERAKKQARSLIPPQPMLEAMMDGSFKTGGKAAWKFSYELIVLTEYYLATKDAQVLPAIEAFATFVSNGQSIFGTVSHGFARMQVKSFARPLVGGYGAINGSSLSCFLGVALAQECGITGPAIDSSIRRSSTFFGSYAGKGSIPYGESQPGDGNHGTNGKAGLAALALSLVSEKAEEASFFVRMAGAAASERQGGHGGPFFNKVWTPLGAAVGGEAVIAPHFSRMHWLLDLSRTWDGDFEWNSLWEGGSGGIAMWKGHCISTLAILTYALPLRQLYITGRGHDRSQWLDTRVAAQVTYADAYDPAGKRTEKLVTDLGHWSPVVKKAAAMELGRRKQEHAALVKQLTNLASTPSSSSRGGACLALGRIAASESAPVLAKLLSDPKGSVRFAAAEGLRHFEERDQWAVVDTILASVAASAKPTIPLDPDDPLNVAGDRASMLLFYAGSAQKPRGFVKDQIGGIDRELLYPAVQAILQMPRSTSRGFVASTFRSFTAADVRALAGPLLDAGLERAPADGMFAVGIKNAVARLLQTHGFAEGVAMSRRMVADDVFNNTEPMTNLERYAGRSKTVRPDPGIEAFCRDVTFRKPRHPKKEWGERAQRVLDAMADDPTPLPLRTFKQIHSVSAESAVLTLPRESTLLKVESSDDAKGDSIYTWRKVHGAGDVRFVPNGTGEAKSTNVFFEGVPGKYLFKITMSDSRGLTEVSEFVRIELRNREGALPDNAPPVARTQKFAVGQGVPTPIILRATDAEGHRLRYRLGAKPKHGVISGKAPFLVYRSNCNYVGTDSFSFRVMDSEGQVAAASIKLEIKGDKPIGVAVYEPFHYPENSQLNGLSGKAEIGFASPWQADTYTRVRAKSLDDKGVIARGGSIRDRQVAQKRGSSFFANRKIDKSALNQQGLLKDGATLWFSIYLGHDSESRPKLDHFIFALANDRFGPKGCFIEDDGKQKGIGVGLMLKRIGSVDGQVRAVGYRDQSVGKFFDTLLIGSWTDRAPPILENEFGLIVGKMTWNKTPGKPDRIELYRPAPDLRLPAEPSSVLTVDIDQATLDTITMKSSKRILLDEIRFGESYQSVLAGTVPMTRDIAAPAPVVFHRPPARLGVDSISMTAATAFDPNGVEYYFSCTSGGGKDSGWQRSPTYVAKGLKPGVSYGYVVRTRDLSVARNLSKPSTVHSATISRHVAMRDLRGSICEHATQLVEQMGLKVGSVKRVRHETILAGRVIGQSVTAGTKVPLGKSVDLTVSLGGALVTAPSFAELSRDAARSAIGKASLRIGTVSDRNHPTITAGRVVSQYPKSGDSVPGNTAVDLVISRGPGVTISHTGHYLGKFNRRARLATIDLSDLSGTDDVVVFFLYSADGQSKPGKVFATFAKQRMQLVGTHRAMIGYLANPKQSEGELVLTGYKGAGPNQLVYWGVARGVDVDYLKTTVGASIDQGRQYSPAFSLRNDNNAVFSIFSVDNFQNEAYDHGLLRLDGDDKQHDAVIKFAENIPRGDYSASTRINRSAKSLTRGATITFIASPPKQQQQQ